MSSVNSDFPVYSAIPPYIRESILDKYLEQPLLNAKKIELMLESMEYTETTPKKLLKNIHNTHETALDVFKGPNLPDSPREVWDAAKSGSLFPYRILNSQSAPDLVLTSQSASKKKIDDDIRICYENMGLIDRFFRTEFSIFPVNNSTHLMKSYVNVQSIRVLNNAEWNWKLDGVMFGVFDGDFFYSPARNLDLATHEFAHAVTQYAGVLKYQEQSGALNESMSDVYAITHKHKLGKMCADSPDTNWLLMDGILKNEEGTAIRSMSNPGSAYFNYPKPGKHDPQVGHMSYFYKLKYGEKPEDHDSGYVHKNSGIPNHAFYLAAKNIGGFSWEKPGQIWNLALHQATLDDDFSTFAKRTIDASRTLKYNENVTHLVSKAWSDVGVDLRTGSPSNISTNISQSSAIEKIIDTFKPKTTGEKIAVGLIGTAALLLGIGAAIDNLDSKKEDEKK